jgi:Flp pilus assembly pilin Flp
MMRSRLRRRSGDLRARLTAWTMDRDEAGQGLAEYGLILLLVAVAVVGALEALGGAVSSSIADSAGQMFG